MRLFPISDLHLERRRLDVIPRPARPFDVLVCPGDLHEGRPELGLAALTTLAQGRPIVLVPGNHEHYWSLAGLWLDGTVADAPEDPVAYAAARMTDPVTGSREYRGSIRNGDGTAWSPADAMAAHGRERVLLAAALAQPHDGPTVCVTHHPASPRAAEAFRHVAGVPWWVPAFYATTVLDDLPEADRPDLWVSGHFHAGHDLRIGRTRWVANPVEGRDFSADHILTID
jgi:predicted MPP superfamily phosphohydrolase